MKTVEETEKGSMVASRCASEEKNFLQAMPKQCHHEPENHERAKERRAKFGGGLIIVADPGEKNFSDRQTSGERKLQICLVCKIT